MKRISSIVLVMLALATTQAGADDWGDCKQTKDEDLSIAGCTVIIESGTQSKANLARAYYDRGVAHAQKGQHDQAIADYDRTIAINPKNADAYGNRGAIYSSKGQYDRAIADYDRAIALNPKYANMYGNRAIAYYYLKKLDKAEADARKALAIDPDNPAKKKILRVILAARGQK